MNQGFLDSGLLEKDIAQIEFYKEEEKKTLNMICTQLEKCANNYNSQNTPFLLNDIENYKLKFKELSSKREEYVPILKRAIEQYDTLSKETVKLFEGEI